MSGTGQTHSVLDGLDGIVGELEGFYRDLHAHPELSLQEHRTAEKAARSSTPGRLRGHRRGRRDRGGGVAAQRRRPDGDAAGGHGRPSGERGDRSALRQRRGPRTTSSLTRRCSRSMSAASTRRSGATPSTPSNASSTPKPRLRGAPKPPEITTTEHYPLTINDAGHTGRVAAALRARFGDDRVGELSAPYSASEDFGSFGTEWGVPSVFWYVGGTDPDVYRAAQAAGRVAEDIPTNHNPRFAPVLQPTIETGVQTMVVAALDALGG